MNVAPAVNVDVRKYGGKYIATASFNSSTVIASDKNPLKVYKKAEKLGFLNPVVNYIHKEGVICMY